MTDVPGGWRGSLAVIVAGMIAAAWWIGGYCVVVPLGVVLVICYVSAYLWPTEKVRKQ